MVLNSSCLLDIEMNVQDLVLSLPEYHIDNVPIYCLTQYIKARYRQEIKSRKYIQSRLKPTDFLLEHLTMDF